MRTSRASLASIALVATLIVGTLPAHAISPYPYIQPVVSSSVTLPGPQVYVPPAPTQPQTMAPRRPAPFGYGIPRRRITPNFGRFGARR
jgi:hypothetical protein